MNTNDIINTLTPTKQIGVMTNRISTSGEMGYPTAVKSCHISISTCFLFLYQMSILYCRKRAFVCIYTNNCTFLPFMKDPSWS